MRPYSLLILCLLITTLATAQRRNAYYGHDDYQRFTVGLAPISALAGIGKVNVRGEWAYAENKSVAVLVGIPRNTRIPSLLANNVNVDEGEETTNTFRSFGLTVENRFYLGADKPRGFYLAPYAQYRRHKLERKVRNTENNTTTSLAGRLNGIGVGGSAGVHFNLAERITLDLTLVGIDLKWISGSIIYKTDDPERDLEQWRTEVADKLDGVPLIGSKIATLIEGQAIKARTPGLVMPGLRFNVSVNYAF